MRLRRPDARDHLGREHDYQVPAFDSRGTPLGIDCREVVHRGILPAVNTGIADREPGIGRVGAGLVDPDRSVRSSEAVPRGPIDRVCCP